MNHANPRRPASDPGTIDLSIVFPCYQAAATLARTLDATAEAFSPVPGGFECIAVDDGSRDGTGKLLGRLAPGRPWLRVLRHPRNLGKGAAVLTGLSAARGRLIVVNDIDLQYGVADMLRCRELLAAGDADLVIGSRVHPGSLYHIRAVDLRYLYTRHVASRLLNALLRATLLPGIQDTQCGLKGFARPFVATLLATGLTVRGFTFDVELLVLARRRGHAIREMPVHFRYTEIPSTVRFLRTGGRVLADLARITWNLLRGRYDPRP